MRLVNKVTNPALAAVHAGNIVIEYATHNHNDNEHSLVDEMMEVPMDMPAGNPSVPGIGHQTLNTVNQGQLPFIPSMLPQSVMTNSLPLASRPTMQPHMANINVTGTSGFRSPMVPVHGVPQLNGTLSQAVSSVAGWVPFAASTASTGYQFPSPMSGGVVNSCMSSSYTRNSLQRTSLMSVGVGISALQPGDPASAWSCPEAWLNLTNGTGTLSSLPALSTMSTPKLSPRASTQSTSCKRKMLTPDQPGHASKVFIDEERMSAHLQDLNLDNNNLAWHPDLQEEPWFSQQNNNNDVTHLREDDVTEEDEMKDDNVSSLPKLHLVEELNNISMKTKEFLPKTILDEIVKPSMQMVLWKPLDTFINEVLPPKEENTDASKCGLYPDIVDLSTSCASAVTDRSPVSLPAMSLHPEHTKNNSELFDCLDDDMDL